MSKPIIPWIGGKRRLADVLLPMFPEHSCYVEPFCGAAALFFMKDPSEVEVINDINGELVNLYRVVQNHTEEFVRQFKWALTSRQVFEWEQLKDPRALTDIQRAARFYYLQKLAFGGRVDGQTYGTATTSAPKLNLMRIEEELSQAYMRLNGVNVEHRSWEKVVEQYDRPHTLFYLDPPYWETEGYGVDFGWEQYENLLALAQSIEGKMIISVNGHPEIRELFADLHCREEDFVYTVGGAHNHKEVKELIYWNDNCEQAPKAGENMALF